MPHSWWTRKNLVLAGVVLACAVVFFATGLSYSEPAASAALGPDWQCTRLAMVFTTCSRMKQSQAVVVPVRIAKAAACSRLRT